MPGQKSLQPVKILPVFLAFELFLSLNYLQPVQAQSPLNIVQNSAEEITTRVQFTPPSKDVPDASEAGGTRDGLKLLLPTHLGVTAQGKTEPVFFGLTTKGKPLFFIHTTNSAIHQIEFTLREIEAEVEEVKDSESQTVIKAIKVRQVIEDIYETTIDVDDNTGVIDIRLPSDAPSLEVGKIYMVSFRYGDTSVDGIIKRVELNPTLNSEIESAEPLEKAAIYAANGIWFDTLEILAELKRSQPENEEDTTDEWAKLLISVGFEDSIAQKPLVE